MFRVNDLVYHVFNMGQVGVVRDMKFIDTGMHLSGGTAGKRLVLEVQMKDGRMVDIPADEAMKEI